MNAASLFAWMCVAVVPLQVSATAESASARDLEYAARDAEQRFSGALSGDGSGEANQYLDRVFQRLLAAAPEPAFSDCRVFLLKGTRPTVFALPHCRLYVSTALFMQLENEAQLAALLARQLAHVKYRHAQLEKDETTRKVDSLHILAIALGAALGGPGPGGYGAGGSGEATSDLIWRVSVRGYSLEHENVADGVGLRRLRDAGHGPLDAIRALERAREVAFEGENPQLPRLASTAYIDRRLANLRAVAGVPGDASPPDATHAALAAALRLDQAELLIGAHDYAGATRLIDEHVASEGEGGRSHWLAGEIARHSRTGSRAQALAAYERGATFPDAPASLFLTQGLLLREDRQHEAARRAFARYLELEPDAADAAFIRLYLGNEPATGE